MIESVNVCVCVCVCVYVRVCVYILVFIYLFQKEIYVWDIKKRLVVTVEIQDGKVLGSIPARVQIFAVAKC